MTARSRCAGRNSRDSGPCQASAQTGHADCARCGGRTKPRAPKVAPPSWNDDEIAARTARDRAARDELNAHLDRMRESAAYRCWHHMRNVRDLTARLGEPVDDVRDQQSSDEDIAHRIGKHHVYALISLVEWMNDAPPETEEAVLDAEEHIAALTGKAPTATQRARRKTSGERWAEKHAEAAHERIEEALDAQSADVMGDIEECEADYLDATDLAIFSAFDEVVALRRAEANCAPRITPDATPAECVTHHIVCAEMFEEGIFDPKKRRASGVTIAKRDSHIMRAVVALLEFLAEPIHQGRALVAAIEATPDDARARIASAHDHEDDPRPSEPPPVIVERDVSPQKDLFGNVAREYACLSMDPPWAERGGGKIKRGADRHYDLAGKLGDIRPIVRAIRESGSFTPAPNAHLWCWYTDTFLEDALALVRELGFTCKRTFQWVKTGGERDGEAVAVARRELLDAAVEAAAEGMLASGRDHHGRTETMSARFSEAMSALSVASRNVEREDGDLRMGIGQYGRGCHEGMIFATRGKGQDPSVWTGDRSVRSVFHAPHPTDEHGKRIHSRKPPRSYELIERVSKGPRVEFFARVARPGWDVWGNQAPEVRT